MRARQITITLISVLSLGWAAQAQDGTAISIQNSLNNLPVSNLNNQPVTNVEASPLDQSRADQLRDARRGAEIQTEQKIVEKLEQDRLESERERAERLFGNFNNKSQQNLAPQVVEKQEVVPEPAPVLVQIVQEEKEEVEEPKVIENSVKTEIARDAVDNSGFKKSYFMSGTLGTAKYDASNVQGNYSAGFSIGVRSSEKIEVEGNFLYSNYYIDESYWSWSNPLYKEMDQYNIGLTAKYLFLSGAFRPFIGGMASYTHRKYQDCYESYGYNNSSYYGGYNNSSNITCDGGAASTKAFDVGFVAGIDFEISDELTVGVDYRYVSNLANKNDPFDNYNYYDEVAVEELDYSLFGLSAKLRF